MNTVLDLIYRLLAHPTDAMSDVTTGEKMKESSIIWGFVILLLALSSVLFCSCTLSLSHRQANIQRKFCFLRCRIYVHSIINA